MERNTAWPLNFVASNRIKGMGMLKRRTHACKAHSRFGGSISTFKQPFGSEGTVENSPAF
jgi:hypothetical protein